MKKFTLLLSAMLLATNLFATDYVKVTSAPADWSGEYILVYENGTTANVWTGVDGVNCYEESTISNNTISGDFITITIAASENNAYSITVNGGDNNGKLIGQQSNSNGLTFNTQNLTNTLAYESDGVKITSSQAVMRFNATSGQMRFRYFKSSTYTQQKAVQLYKLNGGTPCEGYTITVDNEIANGSISANVATACEGETVTLTAEPAEGYALAEWLVFDDADNTIEVTDNKFTMPAANVTVMAEFAEVPKYTIAWNVNGETYTTGEPTTTVIAGEKVTVLPTAPANNTLSCSNVFAGWSTTNIGSKAGEAQPEDLFISAAAAPAVTENTTYYAVFATADGEVKTYLNETFDKTDGTGGNDDQWTGSIATSKVTTDNDGWSLENQGGANKCVKLGGGSKLGKATTPALGLSGSAVLTFRAGAWQNDKEQTTLKVSISVGSLSAETVTLEKGKFNNYSIDITNGTAESTITFAGAQASKSRFFLDDVVVKTNATMKDYRTNCDGISTEIENATVAEKAVKMIENGQLVIIREGVKYNAQGVRL